MKLLNAYSTIKTLIDAVNAKTTNLPSDPADASNIAAVIDAIKLKTDNLPADPADASVISAVIDAIKLKTDNLPASPAATADIANALVGRSGIKKTTIADGTTIPNNSQAVAGLLATASGDLLIEEIIWNRGATNLAGPTNYEFSTDNAKGLTGAGAPVGTALLAKFNAALTGVLSVDAASKVLPFVLEEGKKLYIHGDDAVTSAGGPTDFYIKYTSITNGAELS